MSRRALLIANPGSGLGRTARLADLLARRLARRGLEVELVRTTAGPEAARAAAEAVARGWRRVIIAGGDGTVNSVVGALAHAPASLAVIPTGMANAFARELRLPLGPAAACDLAAAGPTRTIDLGRVTWPGQQHCGLPGWGGGRYFALMAGAGFDADVVAHLDTGLKRRLGPGAYVVAGLRRAMRFRPARVRLSWDGGETRADAILVVAANTAHYTYRWRLAPGARPDDGLLDVVVFRCRGILDPVIEVAGALVGCHRAHPGVVCLRTRALRLEADPALPLQVDGDFAGITPIAMEVVPGALRVVAPPAGPVWKRRAARGGNS